MRRAALVPMLVLAGCAARHDAGTPGAAQPPAAAPAPATYAAPPPAAPPPPAATSAPGSRATDKKNRDALEGDKDATTSGLAQAVAELELWSRSVELALSSCEMACRALGSMERAAKHVCELADDRARCDDAKNRLREARSRVRAACGECRDGPTTDPDAPLR